MHWNQQKECFAVSKNILHIYERGHNDCEKLKLPARTWQLNKQPAVDYYQGEHPGCCFEEVFSKEASKWVRLGAYKFLLCRSYGLPQGEWMVEDTIRGGTVHLPEPLLHNSLLSAIWWEIARKIKPDDMYVSHFRKRMSCIIIVWRGREWLAHTRLFYLAPEAVLPMGIRVLENELCKVVLAASGFRLANFSPNTRYLLFREDRPADAIDTNSERVLSHSNGPHEIFQTCCTRFSNLTVTGNIHEYLNIGWFTSGTSPRRRC